MTAALYVWFLLSENEITSHEARAPNTLMNNRGFLHDAVVLPTTTKFAEPAVFVNLSTKQSLSRSISHVQTMESGCGGRECICFTWIKSIAAIVSAYMIWYCAMKRPARSLLSR